MADKHEMCCICDQKWTFHPSVEGSGIFNHLEDRHYFKIFRCEDCSYCCLTANAMNLHETWMCIGIDSVENTSTSIESKKSTVGKNTKKSKVGTNAKKSELENNAKSSTLGKNAKNMVKAKPKVTKHRGKSSQKDGKTVSPSNDFSDSSSEPQFVNKLSCLRCSEKFTVQELRRHYAKCYATEREISPTVPEESDATMSSASGSNIGTVGNSAAILSRNNISPNIAVIQYEVEGLEGFASIETENYEEQWPLLPPPVGNPAEIFSHNNMSPNIGVSVEATVHLPSSPVLQSSAQKVVFPNTKKTPVSTGAENFDEIEVISRHSSIDEYDSMINNKGSYSERLGIDSSTVRPKSPRLDEKLIRNENDLDTSTESLNNISDMFAFQGDNCNNNQINKNKNFEVSNDKTQAASASPSVINNASNFHEILETAQKIFLFSRLVFRVTLQIVGILFFGEEKKPVSFKILNLEIANWALFSRILKN